jgi:hypothetical protein
MATTVSQAVQLAMCETNGGGRLSWWQVTCDAAAADTELTGSVIVTATVGLGQGQIVTVVDGSALNAGLGILRLNGGATGLTLLLETGAQIIEFRNTVDGASGDAAEAIDDLDIVVMIRS